MFTALLSACTITDYGEWLVSNSRETIQFVSLNNQLCKARPIIVNINSDKNLFYPFTVSVNKCFGSCNTIDDPYSWVCVPNKVKDMNVNISNLISGVNETGFIVELIMRV